MDNPEQEVIFLHCIIHHEALCKSVLQLDDVVKPVVKLVNFFQARGLHHRQFIKFLEDTPIIRTCFTTLMSVG